MFSRMSEQQTVLDNRDSMSPSNPLHWEAEAVCFGVLRNKVYLCGTWDRHAYWLIFYILLKNFYFILEYSHPGGQQRYSAMHIHVFVQAQPLCGVQLFATLWIIACQNPLSLGFSRQEYWSACCFLHQGIFLIQGLNMHLLRLLHCRQICYHKPIREQAYMYPFSSKLPSHPGCHITSSRVPGAILYGLTGYPF